MELNTSQPQHSMIVARSARKPVLIAVVGLVLIGAVLAGSLPLQKEHQIESIRSELRSSEDRFSALVQSDDKNKTDDQAQQTDQATAVALNYSCNVFSFDCDSAQAEVVKIRSSSLDQAGFAIIRLNSANPDDQAMTLWLKQRPAQAGDWLVFYDGDRPPADLIDRFAVPADFIDD